jgi:hypothetical protein
MAELVYSLNIHINAIHGEEIPPGGWIKAMNG